MLPIQIEIIGEAAPLILSNEESGDKDPNSGDDDTSTEDK